MFPLIDASKHDFPSEIFQPWKIALVLIITLLVFLFTPFPFPSQGDLIPHMLFSLVTFVACFLAFEFIALFSTGIYRVLTVLT